MICYTLSAIVNDFTTLKAFYSIEVTEEGTVIFVNDVHPKKEPLPIEVTEEGIVIFASDMHP